MNNIEKNASGYIDPTASEAITNIDKERKRFYKVLHAIFDICYLGGFDVEGRITLKDKKTGRVWK